MDYRSIISIIYNELFLNEDSLNIRKKYLLFNLIAEAMKRINIEEAKAAKEITNVQEVTNELYNMVVSANIQNGLTLFVRDTDKRVLKQRNI